MYKPVKFFLMIVTITFVLTANAQQQDGIYMEKTTTTKAAGVETEKFEKIYKSGVNEVRYITEKRKISMMGNKVEESRSVSIIDKDWIITYDPDTKTGTKIKNTFTDKFSGMSETDKKKFAEGMKDAMNTEVTEEGTGEVAGKTCKITKAVTNMMGMKTTTLTWMYKGIVMEMKSEGIGTNVDELVTKLKEGVKFKQHKIPDDVTIKEVKSPF
jgi:hypothetical protein